MTEVHNFDAPDGQYKEIAQLINGGFPGPTIEADWGDVIEVTVINNMDTNGTSIHWHGIRMLNNNINDGVNGITECALPPGSQKTYRFLAEQYGTSWYHSHFSGQYANGVVGAIVINGPASLPYDIDLGVLQITDWYYGEAEAITAFVQDPNRGGGRPPSSDNILFNGKHVHPSGTGEYLRTTLTPGKRHRLRLINTSVDNSFTVSLVGHDMTIIQTDFVPVWSYTTDSIFMTVGQRFDVTIDASQEVDNYWFNVTMGTSGACGTSYIEYPASIFTYKGADKMALPTNPGSVPADKKCEDTMDLVPVIAREPTLEGFEPVGEHNIPVELSRNDTHVFWNVHGTPMMVAWDYPTLQYVRDGKDPEPQRNVFTVADDPEWSVWVIQNNGAVPHPMHLHGHDFLVLGRSPAYDSPLFMDASANRVFTEADVNSLNLQNPPRRDTTQLPGWGWLVVAFKTDNPGAWVFHCHIAWHVSQGLSLQYIERGSEIATTMDLSELDEVCAAWDAFPHKEPQIDSGLRL